MYSLVPILKPCQCNDVFLVGECTCNGDDSIQEYSIFKKLCSNTRKFLFKVVKDLKDKHHIYPARILTRAFPIGLKPSDTNIVDQSQKLARTGIKPHNCFAMIKSSNEDCSFDDIQRNILIASILVTYLYVHDELIHMYLSTSLESVSKDYGLKFERILIEAKYLLFDVEANKRPTLKDILRFERSTKMLDKLTKNNFEIGINYYLDHFFYHIAFKSQRDRPFIKTQIVLLAFLDLLFSACYINPKSISLSNAKSILNAKRILNQSSYNYLEILYGQNFKNILSDLISYKDLLKEKQDVAIKGNFQSRHGPFLRKFSLLFKNTKIKPKNPFVSVKSFICDKKHEKFPNINKYFVFKNLETDPIENCLCVKCRCLSDECIGETRRVFKNEIIEDGIIFHPVDNLGKSFFPKNIDEKQKLITYNRGCPTFSNFSQVADTFGLMRHLKISVNPHNFVLPDGMLLFPTTIQWNHFKIKNKSGDFEYNHLFNEKDTAYYNINFPNVHLISLKITNDTFTFDYTIKIDNEIVQYQFSGLHSWLKTSRFKQYISIYYNTYKTLSCHIKLPFRCYTDGSLMYHSKYLQIKPTHGFTCPLCDYKYNQLNETKLSRMTRHFLKHFKSTKSEYVTKYRDYTYISLQTIDPITNISREILTAFAKLVKQPTHTEIVLLTPKSEFTLLLNRFSIVENKLQLFYVSVNYLICEAKFDMYENDKDNENDNDNDDANYNDNDDNENKDYDNEMLSMFASFSYFISKFDPSYIPKSANSIIEHQCKSDIINCIIDIILYQTYTRQHVNSLSINQYVLKDYKNIRTDYSDMDYPICGPGLEIQKSPLHKQYYLEDVIHTNEPKLKKIFPKQDDESINVTNNFAKSEIPKIGKISNSDLLHKRQFSKLGNTWIHNS